MPARYAFLGPEGTFAHAALRTLPGADEAELVPMAMVTLAILAVRGGTVDGALVPLENSIEGAVPATLDELAGGDLPLHIAQETYLPVEFDLLARPGTTLADVQTVATHPHAEAQVRRYLLSVAHRHLHGHHVHGRGRAGGAGRTRRRRRGTAGGGHALRADRAGR
jgi:prephenate dehydratase